MHWILILLITLLVGCQQRCPEPKGNIFKAMQDAGIKQVRHIPINDKSDYVIRKVKYNGQTYTIKALTTGCNEMYPYFNISKDGQPLSLLEEVVLYHTGIVAYPCYAGNTGARSWYPCKTDVVRPGGKFEYVGENTVLQDGNPRYVSINHAVAVETSYLDRLETTVYPYE